MNERSSTSCLSVALTILLNLIQPSSKLLLDIIFLHFGLDKLEGYDLVYVLSAEWALAVLIEEYLRAARAERDVLAGAGDGVSRIRQADEALLRLLVVRPRRLDPVGLCQLVHLLPEEDFLLKEPDSGG